MANPDWMPKWLKKIVNVIDTPWDKFKHFLNGLELYIFGRYYKFRTKMGNKPGSKWSVKRIDEFSDPNKTNRQYRLWW